MKYCLKVPKESICNFGANEFNNVGAEIRFNPLFDWEPIQTNKLSCRGLTCSYFLRWKIIIAAEVWTDWSPLITYFEQAVARRYNYLKNTKWTNILKQIKSLSDKCHSDWYSFSKHDSFYYFTRHWWMFQGINKSMPLKRRLFQHSRFVQL